MKKKQQTRIDMNCIVYDKQILKFDILDNYVCWTWCRTTKVHVKCTCKVHFTLKLKDSKKILLQKKYNLKNKNFFPKYVKLKI